MFFLSIAHPENFSSGRLHGRGLPPDDALDGEQIDGQGDDRGKDIRDRFAPEDIFNREEHGQDEHAGEKDDFAEYGERQRNFYHAETGKAVHDFVLDGERNRSQRVDTDQPGRHINVFGVLRKDAGEQMWDHLRGKEHQRAEADGNRENHPLCAENLVRPSRAEVIAKNRLRAHGQSAQRHCDQKLEALHDRVAGQKHIAVARAAVLLKHHVEGNQHYIVEQNDEERAHADDCYTADDF